jgi:ribosomal 50S subunit-recycling heat shock protein
LGLRAVALALRASQIRNPEVSNWTVQFATSDFGFEMQDSSDFKISSSPYPKVDRMRLDLFLKWSRVILRRTLAKDTCDAGRVTVNGQEAKASREVRVGDTVSIRLPRRQLTFRICSIPSHSPGKEGAREMIEIVNS